MGTEGLNALREASRLSVEVSELLHKPGTSKRLEFSEEVAGMGLDMGHVEPLLDFDLLLESLVEGVLVTGNVRGTVRLACIRCLREFDRPLVVPLSEVLAYEGQPGAEEDYQVVGDHVILEPLVRDTVLLAMPLNPLCRADCKGLCPQCGADRNETDCGHRAGRQDVRWEPLRSLKETMGE